jgi:hypothetical protein
MALSSKLLTAGCTATTAAGTNTLKTTAMVNAVVDAAMHEMAKCGAVTPNMQNRLTAFKADMLTNVATIRIAIYGS